jgi:hypothetical protein
MPASVSMYVYVLDLRGGAPPVMDGIVPGIGPDVDLCVNCHVKVDAPGLFVL